MALWRVLVDGEPRVAVGPVGAGPELVLAPSVTVGGLLARGAGAVEAAARGELAGAPFAGEPLLAPCDGQEIWAAGVTFERSREARGEESDHGDVYDRVYEAERPELFLKATLRNVRGPGEALGIRADSSWDVPEPELALVLSAAGELAGFTIGNDMSSRSIEGENPLYLPQAKVYPGSCSLGPWIELLPGGGVPVLEIELAVERDGAEVYRERFSTASMARPAADLCDHLWRTVGGFGRAVYLFTGTGSVPEAGFGLRAGDRVGVGAGPLSLDNPVEMLAGASRRMP